MLRIQINYYYYYYKASTHNYLQNIHVLYFESKSIIALFYVFFFFFVLFVVIVTITVFDRWRLYNNFKYKEKMQRQIFPILFYYYQPHKVYQPFIIIIMAQGMILLCLFKSSFFHIHGVPVRCPWLMF